MGSKAAWRTPSKACALFSGGYCAWIQLQTANSSAISPRLPATKPTFSVEASWAFLKAYLGHHGIFVLLGLLGDLGERY